MVAVNTGDYLSVSKGQWWWRQQQWKGLLHIRRH